MRARNRIILAAAAATVLLAPALAGDPARRSFRFTYEATVEDLPAGAGRVAVWIPYPTSDEHQEISDVAVDAPVPTRVERDPATGNAMLYLESGDASMPLRVRLTFDVVRREYVRRTFDRGRDRPVDPTDPALASYLGADRLIPLDERVRALAAEVTRGRTTDRDKARAIYDYVVSTMKYDKSGEGWGRGDILWACDAKRGNCTDFHALFIGLARASGIPARFSIGFPLPPARGEGEIGGYHCWAEFWLQGYGWVPIDASEAAKQPDRREYFFGAHDENRVQMSTGRDLTLAPRQQGDPLNFFVYPYVEVDGRPFKGVTRAFRFKDLG